MRTRRKKSEMPFADALDAAQKRLKHAQKEMDAAQKAIAALNIEIPNLQNTITMLQRMLEKAPMPVWVPPPPYVGNAVTIPMTPKFEHEGQTVDELPSEEDSLLPEPDGTPILE